MFENSLFNQTDDAALAVLLQIHEQPVLAPRMRSDVNARLRVARVLRGDALGLAVVAGATQDDEITRMSTVQLLYAEHARLKCKQKT